MPNFTRLDPKDVQIGRARSAYESRHPYCDAPTGSEAGRIELGRGEKASIVKRYLSDAAHEVGVKIDAGASGRE